MANLDDFYIIRPVGTRNLVYGTVIWGYGLGAVSGRNGAALVNSQAQVRYHGYSWQVTPSTQTNSGIYVLETQIQPVTPLGVYSASVDIWGANGESYKLLLTQVDNTQIGAATVTTTGGWVRLSIPGATIPTGVTQVRLHVIKNGTTSVTPFYVDGWQLEPLPFDTTYVDGDQPGCAWEGNPYTGTSIRSDQYRGGGIKIFLASTFGAMLQSQTGTGMPPINTNTVTLANTSGSVLYNQTANERQMTLTFSIAGTDMPNFHQRRQAFINVIRPDLVTPPQPFVLGYVGGIEPVEIECVYTAGLELQAGQYEIESSAIQFLAMNPFWRKVGVKSASTPMGAVYSSFKNLARRTPDNLWDNMGGGTNETVRSIKRDAYSGRLFFAGLFTQIAGNAYSYIASLDTRSNTWQAEGGFNGGIRDMYIGTQGEIIVCGSFTSINGGTASDSVAYRQGGAGSTGWQKSTGVRANSSDGVAFAITRQRNSTGNIYVGGTMSGYLKTGGYSPTSNTWGFSTTSTAPNGPVYALAVSPDGQTVYVGGHFSTAGANVAVTNIYAIDGNNHIVPMGSGLPGYNPNTGEPDPAIGQVEHIFVAPDGSVYAVGTFGMVSGLWYAPYNGAYLGIRINAVAKWNGFQWEPLANGLTIGAYSATAARDGSIIADGTVNMTNQQYTPITTLVRWDGSAWRPYDFFPAVTQNERNNPTENGDTPRSFRTFATYTDFDGTFYGSYDYRDVYTTFNPNQAFDLIGAAATIITNTGSTEAYPVIDFFLQFAEHLYSIRNKTTGKAIYFKNLSWGKYRLDLRPGTRGLYRLDAVDVSQADKIVVGSHLSTFTLAPGQNVIEIFATNEVYPTNNGAFHLPTATWTWQEQHWSLDGGS